jgi:3-methyladenine DNA glycosylase/8-oxoguanine DNA glycosylase
MGEASPNVADEVPAALRLRFPGLRAFAYGSLFDGVVSSIVGQSISVASAAVTGRRLAALFHPGLAVLGRTFWPLPRADQLAHATPALVRTSGVTWRRADALVAVGRTFANDEGDGVATRSADELRRWLRALPLVGPWTAESALLWGLGDGDAYPTGDVALLRAARVAYDRPGLDMKGLDRLAEGWRPHRGWVARLLWTALLGPAPPGTAPPGGAAVSATL